MWFGCGLQKRGLDFVFFVQIICMPNASVFFCCLSVLWCCRDVLSSGELKVCVFDLQVSLVPAVPGPPAVCDTRGEHPPLQ